MKKARNWFWLMHWKKKLFQVKKIKSKLSNIAQNKPKWKKNLIKIMLRKKFIYMGSQKWE